MVPDGRRSSPDAACSARTRSAGATTDRVLQRRADDVDLTYSRPIPTRRRAHACAQLAATERFTVAERRRAVAQMPLGVAFDRARRGDVVARDRRAVDGRGRESARARSSRSSLVQRAAGRRGVAYFATSARRVRRGRRSTCAGPRRAPRAAQRSKRSIAGERFRCAASERSSAAVAIVAASEHAREPHRRGAHAPAFARVLSARDRGGSRCGRAPRLMERSRSSRRSRQPDRRGRGRRASGERGEGAGRERAGRRGDARHRGSRARRPRSRARDRRRRGDGRGRRAARPRAARDEQDTLHRGPVAHRHVRLSRRGAAVDRVGVAPVVDDAGARRRRRASSSSVEGGGAPRVAAVRARRGHDHRRARSVLQRARAAEIPEVDGDRERARERSRDARGARAARRELHARPRRQASRASTSAWARGRSGRSRPSPTRRSSDASARGGRSGSRRTSRRRRRRAPGRWRSTCS